MAIRRQATLIVAAVAVGLAVAGGRVVHLTVGSLAGVALVALALIASALPDLAYGTPAGVRLGRALIALVALGAIVAAAGVGLLWWRRSGSLPWRATVTLVVVAGLAFTAQAWHWNLIAFT